MAFDVRDYIKGKSGKGNSDYSEGQSAEAFDVRKYIEHKDRSPKAKDTSPSIFRPAPYITPSTRIQSDDLADRFAQAWKNYAAKAAAGKKTPIGTDRLAREYDATARSSDAKDRMSAVPAMDRGYGGTAPSEEYTQARNQYMQERSAQRTALQAARSGELERLLTTLQDAGKTAEDYHTPVSALDRGYGGVGIPRADGSESDISAQLTERKLVRLEKGKDRAKQLREFIAAQNDPEFAAFKPTQKPADPYANIGGTRAFGGADQTPVDLTQYMTDAEKKLRDYTRLTKGDAAAAEYEALIRNDLEARYTDAEVKRSQEYAQEHPVRGSALSVLENIPKALSGTVYTAAQAIKNEDINPRAIAYAPELRQSAARETVSKDMGEVGSFLYDTGMSMADFVSLVPLGSTGASAVLGAGAFQSTAREATENGADLEQAITLGAVAGAAEIVTEKIGMERLFGIFNNNTGGAARAIVRQMVLNGFPEAGEEVITEVVNIIADIAVLGADSKWTSQYDALINSGVSPDAASKQVVQQALKNALVAGAGGFLSGAVMAGGSATLGNIAGNVAMGERLRVSGRLSDGMNEAVASGSITQAQADNIMNNSGGDSLKGIVGDYRIGSTVRKAAQNINARIMNDVNADIGQFVDVNKAAAARDIMQSIVYGDGVLTQSEAQLVSDDRAINRIFNKLTGINVSVGTPEQHVRAAALAGNKGSYDGITAADIDAAAPAPETQSTTPDQAATPPQIAPAVINAEAESDASAATDSVSSAAIVAENAVQPRQPDITNVNIDTATPEADLADYYARSRQYAEQQQAAVEQNARNGKPAQRFGDLARAGDGRTVVRSDVNSNLTERQKSAVRVLQHLSTAGNMNIVVHDTFAADGQFIDETPNGYYDRDTNTLHIALDAEKSVVLVASHELTHFIQQWSPVQYENLKDYIRQSYNEQEAGLMDSLVRKKMADLTAAGRENVTYAVAEDEVIADACEMFLSDGDAISRLAKKNKTLGGKIADFIRTILKDLAAAMRGVDATSAEAITLRENISYFQQAQELWTKALEEAAEAHRYAPYDLDINTNKQTNSYTESTRTGSKSSRELLADAQYSVAQTLEEEQRIADYRRAAKNLDEKQAELREVRLQLRELAFAPSDRRYDGTYESKIAGLEKKAETLERNINWWDKRMLSLEATKPLRDVLSRERAKTAKSMQKKARENMRQYQKDARDSANLTHYQNMVMKHSRDLMRWMLRPTDAKHVPEAYRKVTSRFLNTIDMSFRSGTVKDSRWRSDLLAMRGMISNLDAASSKEDYSGFYAEIDPDLLARIDAFISDTGEAHSLGDMTADQLKGLNLVLTILKKCFMESNECKANTKFKTVSEMSESSLRDMYKQTEKRASARKIIDAVDKLLNIDELDSFSYFEELGAASYSVLDSLRKGFDKRVRKIEQAMNYMSDLVKDDSVKKWSGTNSPAKTYAVSGGEIKLTTAQVMELYELSKRAQAQEHLYNGGIKSADLIAVDNKKKSRIAKTEPVGISEQDVKAITDTLTPRQKEVADAMQRFLEREVAAWGNETSMQMYGYLKFFTKNYYPISVDKHSTGTVSPETNVGLYALKNVGATKATIDEAKNALVINDIFDTFSRHVDEMASYNGLVAPLSDAMKWYNYKSETSSSRGVKQGIHRLMGKPGTDYFINFIKDLNGTTKGSYGTDIAAQLISNVKVASVSANVRVVLQQPTAYVRAAAVMDPKYLLKGKASKRSMQRMLDHSAIATWKSWGFFDTNLGVTMRDLIVGDQSIAGKLREAGLWAAGKADDITWAALWSATESEIQDKHKDLTIDSDEYFAAVSDRFSEIVDRTQVVDTLFHRSQMMRSKDFLVKDLTSFMAEPTKTYNMLRSAAVAMVREKTRESRIRFARVSTVYITTGIATAAAAAVADAFRDKDDKDEDGNKIPWIDKYKKACLGNITENVNPLTLIPVFSDLFSMIDGYSQKSLMFSGFEAVINSAKAWDKYIAGESKSTAYALISNSVKALSKLTGIPAGSLLRTFESLYNTIAPENIPMKKAQLKK